MDERRLVTKEQRQSASEQAKQLLISHPLFISSQSIACYLAQDQEFDCASMIHAIWESNKRCYLPVLSLSQEKKLEFAEYRKDSILKMNRYQILEPASEEKYPASQLDLVLVPLVGFDKYGHRLGMGGGYYDRTFAFKRKVPRPFLLGVGFARQEVEKIPYDEWDVMLDGILTQDQLIVIK